jgi:ketosteroid isomerase-like protein
VPVVSVEQLADVAALRRVVDEYALAVDGRDAEAFADLFTEDATLAIYEHGADEPALTYDGRERLLGVTDLLRTFSTTMHVMANHVCDVDGDQATGRVYALCHHLTEADDGAQDTLMLLQYRDRYRRVDGAWRIARRDVLRQWTELHGAERAALMA